MVVNLTLKSRRMTWHAEFFKTKMKNIEAFLRRQLKSNLDLEELQTLIEHLS